MNGTTTSRRSRAMHTTEWLALAALLAATCAGAQGPTALVLANQTGRPVTVGVVLAALGGACPAAHPPVTADQLAAAGFCSNVTNSSNPPYAGKCTLTLPAGAAKTFPSFPGTCLSGNVTFGGYGTCPDSTFPNGTTTAEFTLNPVSGDEAIDLSLVNGHNAFVSMSTQGGSTWKYGPSSKPIAAFQNQPGSNVGNPGVYPTGCTTCTGLSGGPVCPGFPAKPTCQSQAICNVQRPKPGGTVRISLLSLDAKGQKEP